MTPINRCHASKSCDQFLNISFRFYNITHSRIINYLFPQEKTFIIMRKFFATWHIWPCTWTRLVGIMNNKSDNISYFFRKKFPTGTCKQSTLRYLKFVFKHVSTYQNITKQKTKKLEQKMSDVSCNCYANADSKQSPLNCKQIISVTHLLQSKSGR